MISDRFTPARSSALSIKHFFHATKERMGKIFLRRQWQDSREFSRRFRKSIPCRKKVARNLLAGGLTAPLADVQSATLGDTTRTLRTAPRHQLSRRFPFRFFSEKRKTASFAVRPRGRNARFEPVRNRPMHDMEIVSAVRALLSEKLGAERFDLWFGTTTFVTGND